MTDESTTQDDTATTDSGTTADVTQYVGTDGKPLSPRQNGVYAMHKSGMSNVAIAEALDIAPGTVSNALVAAKTRMGEANGNQNGDMDVTQFVDAKYRNLRDTITQAHNTITQAMGEVAKIRVLAIATEVQLNDAQLGDVFIDMSTTRTEKGDDDSTQEGDES